MVVDLVWFVGENMVLLVSLGRSEGGRWFDGLVNQSKI